MMFDVLLAVCAAIVLTPSPAWSPHTGELVAPVRCIVEKGDGVLVGARGGNGTINMWESGDGGLHWKETMAGVVRDVAPESFGDVTTWWGSVGGHSNVLLVAYREQWGTTNFSVSMIASLDGGATWSNRMLIQHPPTGPNQFVGAPFIKQLHNGTIAIFYDSEAHPTSIGLPGSQWIMFVVAGFQPQNRAAPFAFYPERVASRNIDSTEPSRDGMATVVDVGEGVMLLVCEGIARNQFGNQQDVVLAQLLRNDGGSIDFQHDRSIVYAPSKTVGNKSFNAYCPYTTITPDGKVLVVFSTDEDAPTPATPGFDPYAITNSVKYVTSSIPVAAWDPPSTLYASSNHTYLAGVMTTNRTLVSTIRQQDGNEVIYTDPGFTHRKPEHPRYTHAALNTRPQKPL